ncbi:MAG: immunoglobulin-like domain-containing protein, partial [Cellulosilyticaceae bacterium]
TIKSSGWQNLEPGASTNLQGMIGLCFGGLRNLTFNGMIPAGKDANVNTAPEIQGAEDTVLTVGDTFDVMAGITAYDKQDGDLTSEIQVEGTVDTAIAGIYTITYTVIDAEGRTITVVRTVRVNENTAPELYGVEHVTLAVGSSFDVMTGVTAYDKEDGDLTVVIQVEGEVDTAVEGVYEVTYTVVDSKGAVTSVIRVVTVEKLPNTAPEIQGVQDVTLTVGDAFDAMTGVTAYDKEDGDLTAIIQVTGEVDTELAGTYELTYSVTDSEGLQTVATSVVTVEAKGVTPEPGDTYDSAKIYNTGDKVIYKGAEYTAKWWVQGQAPDTSDAWEKAPEIDGDGYEVYMPGKAYVGGVIVKHNGQLYKAKWWTTQEPGTGEEWEIL